MLGIPQFSAGIFLEFFLLGISGVGMPLTKSQKDTEFDTSLVTGR